MADESATGDEPLAFWNPVTGVQVRGIEGDAGDGEASEVPEGTIEIRLPPGARGPAEHVHPSIEERFEVLEGEVTFRIDGRERRLGPGTSVRVSSGTPHAFRNDGDRPATMRGRTLPDSERLAEVVVTLFGLAHDGAVDDRGRPSFLQAMVMAEAAADETRFVSPPEPVQRALAGVFGPLGRAFGYRATYDRYLDEGFWRARQPADEATRAGGSPTTDAGTRAGVGAGAGAGAGAEGGATPPPGGSRTGTGSGRRTGRSRDGIEVPVVEE